MIINTQFLQEFRNFERQPKNIRAQRFTSRIVREIWPQSNHNGLSEVIQQLAVKWMNQFAILIENWLNETSSKYLLKLKRLLEQNADEVETDKIQQYIFNLSKYIQSMQYPALTSIKNINNLYLKYPSEELIQESKKPPLTRIFTTEQSPLFQKKKSLSIKSFSSSNQTKSRSSSKSRKFSFFNNSVKGYSNLFQTISNRFKQKDNLNTTVKKVKKQISFSKTNDSCMNTFQQNAKNCQNQKQNQQIKASDISMLKIKLEQKLSKTSPSAFRGLLKKMQFKPINSQKMHESQNLSSFPKENAPNFATQIIYQKTDANRRQRINLHEDLKKQILGQISATQKIKYQNFLQDIQIKLNSKFDHILEKLLKQKNSQESINKVQQNETQLKATQPESKDFPSNKNIPNYNKTEKIHKNQFYQEQNSLKNQNIFDKISSSRINQSKIQNNFSIEDIQPLKSNKKKDNNKSNTSTIIREDSSNIIKSKQKKSPSTDSNRQNKRIVQQSNTQKIKEAAQIIIDSKNIQNEKIARNNKEDNFYMKRIKQMKNKMQLCIKNYKNICDKLILPVNQTFLLLFSVTYQKFCVKNFLPAESRQAVKVLQKYTSKTQIVDKLPQNQGKFLIDSLGKIQKMINLKCPAEKMLKIEQYAQNCISCIENVYFEKQEIDVDLESQILKKIREIKSYFPNSRANDKNL